MIGKLNLVGFLVFLSILVSVKGKNVLVIWIIVYPGWVTHINWEKIGCWKHLVGWGLVNIVMWFWIFLVGFLVEHDPI